MNNTWELKEWTRTHPNRLMLPKLGQKRLDLKLELVPLMFQATIGDFKFLVSGFSQHDRSVTSRGSKKCFVSPP